MHCRYYILSLMILLMGALHSWSAEWEATITATNIDDPGVSPRLLTFGVAPGASDEYDPLDVPFPPPGQPPINLDAAFIISGPFARLTKDVRPEAAANQWQLDVCSDTGGIRLTWDISGVPLDKCVLLVNSETIDMRAQSSLDLIQGQYSLMLHVLDDPDLAISKIVDNSTPNEGDIVTYMITVTNNGPNPATGVEVTDLLPSGVTYVSDIPGQGSYNSGTGLWSVGALSNGMSAILTIAAAVDLGTGGSTITNTATVTAMDQADPDTSNNSDSVDITVQHADLGVGKKVDNPTPNEGDTVTYMVTVTNNGPDPAIGIEITDLLPSGVTYVSHTSGQGSYNNSTGLWSVGALSNGMSAVLTIAAAVDLGTGSSTITNTATLKAMDQADPSISNNSDSADITVQGGDTTPPAAVTLVTGDIAIDSVVLTWLAPGDDGMEGNAFEYDIRYSESPMSNERKWRIATQCNDEPSPLSAGKPQSFTVNSLSPNTTYYFALKTADEALNWSETSNTVSAMTKGSLEPTNQKIHVSSVVMSLRETGLRVNAIVTVTVVDEAGIGIEGASVLGYWAGLTGGTDEGVTDASGMASLNSRRLRKPSPGQFTFTVGAVAKDGCMYDKTANFMNPPSGSIPYPQTSPAYAGAYRTDLKNAYPSPGNPETWIPFTLSDAEHVAIKIYSATGGLVRTLDLGQKAPGAYISRGRAAYWDGRNEAGEEITSGLYFYLMEAGLFRAMKKLAIVK